MLLSRILSATPGAMYRPNLKSGRSRASANLKLSRITQSCTALNPQNVGGKYGDEFRPD